MEGVRHATPSAPRHAWQRGGSACHKGISALHHPDWRLPERACRKNSGGAERSPVYRPRPYGRTDRRGERKD